MAFEHYGKNCVKVDSIFCYFVLLTGVWGYIFAMFCISVGMAHFIGNASLKILSQTTFYISTLVFL